MANKRDLERAVKSMHDKRRSEMFAKNEDDVAVITGEIEKLEKRIADGAKKEIRKVCRELGVKNPYSDWITPTVIPELHPELKGLYDKLERLHDVYKMEATTLEEKVNSLLRRIWMHGGSDDLVKAIKEL